MFRDWTAPCTHCAVLTAELKADVAAFATASVAKAAQGGWAGAGGERGERIQRPTDTPISPLWHRGRPCTQQGSQTRAMHAGAALQMP